MSLLTANVLTGLLLKLVWPRVPFRAASIPCLCKWHSKKSPVPFVPLPVCTLLLGHKIAKRRPTNYFWLGWCMASRNPCKENDGNGHIKETKKKVREKSRECHNHKPQPFPDPTRKRKPTNLNKHKPNKRTKSTKISSLFPKQGNCNTKRTEKHKNKMTHGKTYNKSPRRINHKATRSKTNTGTTALERSVEQTTGGLKHFNS